MKKSKNAKELSTNLLREAPLTSPLRGGAATQNPQTSRNPPPGSVSVFAHQLPLSPFLSTESREALLTEQNEDAASAASRPLHFDTDEDFLAQRAFSDNQFAVTAENQARRYAVNIKTEAIGGVRSVVVTPKVGIPAQNSDRVLINLHGGGFILGAKYGMVIESTPISALGMIKVVSVDYHLAPEHRHPAARNDVVAVYRELLKRYEPANIGIYGCSAGALLAAQAIALFQDLKLPLPGAIGMFSGAASHTAEGDSGAPYASIPFVTRLTANPYFRDVDPDDPLVRPATSPSHLAKFPPSLLVTATRDMALSSVAFTHTQLITSGVAAQLHVWEGLGHAFFYNSNLSESRQAYEVIVGFFDKHLGGKQVV